MNNSNSNRIFNNTIVLYFRLLFGLVVSLYISRELLNILGVVDLGVQNVVGSVIGMLAFLNGALTETTQRFFNFEVGKDNKVKLNKVFNSAMLIYIGLAILIFIVGLTIGLWYFNTQINLPADRRWAGRWVYYLSVLGAVFGVLIVPYNALIIANEKMSAFAYISLSEVILKLLAVLSLNYFEFDSLILYATFLFCISIIIRLVYVVYCKKHFTEIELKLQWDKIIAAEMLTFASWSFLNHFSGITITQGLNLLLNAFFGPAINAARALATQLQNAISGFAVNFQTALNPQITKSFAKNDMNYMHNLIFISSKFSYFILLIFISPVFIETNFILSLWLKLVPEHTISFVRIILLTTLFDVISNPLLISAQATGNIKRLNIILSLVRLIILPLSYLLLKSDYPPEAVFILHMCNSILCLIVSLLLTKSLIKLSIKSYLEQVVLKIVLVTLLSLIIPLCLYFLLAHNNWFSFILVCISGFASSIIAIYGIGLGKEERVFINNKLKIIMQYSISKK